jgi:ABC-type nitrate/sulfonate/bicarbonate transport system permease component
VEQPAGLGFARLRRILAVSSSGVAARPIDRAAQDRASDARLDVPGPAADPGHRLAAAVPDPVRIGLALGCFYPILLNTIFGVRSVEPRLFEAAAMLGISRAALFPKVVLPSASPSIFTGLRLGLGFAWVVIVVGEISGVRVGLGAMIENAREVSRTDVVIAGMIVIGLAGYLSDQAIRALSRRVLRWSPQHG